MKAEVDEVDQADDNDQPEGHVRGADITMMMTLKWPKMTAL